MFCRKCGTENKPKKEHPHFKYKDKEENTEFLNFATSSREILNGFNANKMMEIPTNPGELTNLFKEIKK